MPSIYDKCLDQLKLCKINGGIYIDAGCGTGSYTFPLSTMVDKVIAIDKSSSTISRLKNSYNEDEIEFYKKDFETDELYHNKVDGVLFAFSLHYLENPLIALKNALFNLKKLQGCIIIIEYVRRDPVPWIPIPFPISKLEAILSILDEIKLNSELIFLNSKYYIMKIAYSNH